MTTATTDGAPDPPVLLRVLSGDPTAEELAALIAVVAARRAPAQSSAPVAARSEWAAHSRRLRGIHRHGPGAWRATAWPR